ncbi:MAG: DNA alkylation repair protein [Luteolibacter sp.]
MSEMAEDSKDFKDIFDHRAAKELAAQVHGAWEAFDRKRFLKLATHDLASLEMTPRVRQFSNALAAILPTEIPSAIEILVQSLPAPMESCDDLKSSWIQWPVAHFISEHGLPHYDQSMAALREITMRFTSEFAVRSFAAAYPQKVYLDLLKLTADPNPHVRRWCSEGSRPRLPWGQRLNDLVADPSPLWPILDALRNDPELYVRRSVANNLNDIAKDHSELVVRKCAEWMKSGSSNELDQLIRHALRTLIKNGNPSALALLGYSPIKQTDADFSITGARIPIGNSLELSLTLISRNQADQKLVIDFAMHFLRKNGTHSRKVFKWKSLTLPAGETLTLSKKHPLKKTTIRALYPGLHRIELLANGANLAEIPFELLAE